MALLMGGEKGCHESKMDALGLVPSAGMSPGFRHAAPGGLSQICAAAPDASGFNQKNEGRNPSSGVYCQRGHFTKDLSMGFITGSNIRVMLSAATLVLFASGSYVCLSGDGSARRG